MKRTLGLAGRPVEIHSRDLYTTYTGTKEALIAGNFATSDMFPEGRKRIKYLLGPDIPKEQEYRTSYVKGGLYRIQRWHDRKPQPRPQPPAFNAERFREQLLFGTATALEFFAINPASGEAERKTCGKWTHRLSEADQAEIHDLTRKLLDVIRNAHVERGRTESNVVSLPLVK